MTKCTLYCCCCRCFVELDCAHFQLRRTVTAQLLVRLPRLSSNPLSPSIAITLATEDNSSFISLCNQRPHLPPPLIWFIQHVMDFIAEQACASPHTSVKEALRHWFCLSAHRSTGTLENSKRPGLFAASAGSFLAPAGSRVSKLSLAMHRRRADSTEFWLQPATELSGHRTCSRAKQQKESKKAKI